MLMPSGAASYQSMASLNGGQSKAWAVALRSGRAVGELA
jgi:hypothetical protein